VPNRIVGNALDLGLRWERIREVIYIAIDTVLDEDWVRRLIVHCMKEKVKFERGNLGGGVGGGSLPGDNVSLSSSK
jgi:hypothetical protein